MTTVPFLAASRRNETFGFRYIHSNWNGTREALPYSMLPASVRNCTEQGPCYNFTTREKWWERHGLLRRFLLLSMRLLGGGTVRCRLWDARAYLTRTTIAHRGSAVSTCIVAISAAPSPCWWPN